jgi:phytoene/squalene synthetase
MWWNWIACGKYHGHAAMAAAADHGDGMGDGNVYLPMKTDWRAIDWSLQDCEIARLEGRTPSTVCVNRKKAGAKKSARHKRWRMLKVTSQYKNVDWAEHDTHIARQLGVTKQRVGIVRRLLKKYPRVQ